jgi:outer membrane protein TolC
MNNLQLRQYEKDVKIAEAQFGESFADFLMPGISLTGNYSLSDPLTVSNNITKSPSSYIFDGSTLIPNEFTTLTNVYPDTYSAGVTVSKTLFMGFILCNSLEIKKIALELARKKYDEKKREIVCNTELSAYNLAVLRENINLSEELNRQLSNQLRFSVNNFKNGLVSEYDKIRVEVLYKNNLPKLLLVRSAYILAAASFYLSIGVKDYDNIELLVDLMDYTNLTMTNTDEALVLPKAISNSIELISIEYTNKTLELTKRMNEGNLYPSVSAAFNYQYNYRRYFSDKDRNWWPSWYAGLQLSWALDSWIPASRTWKTSEELQQTILKNDFGRQLALDNLKIQVKTLLLQQAVSAQNILSQQDCLKQAKMGIKMANDKYMAGTASSIDLSETEISYNQAQANYLQAIYDYYSSTLKLKKMIGE